MTDGETGSDRLEESQDWLLQVYRATFEQAQDAILIQDYDGVLYCNAALFALLRIPDEADCQTLTIINTSAPYQDDGQPVSGAATAKLEQVLSHGTAFFEWRSRTSRQICSQGAILAPPAELAVSFR